jgi:hypothetical protein
MMFQLVIWGRMSAADLRDVYVTSLVRLLYHLSPHSIAHLNFFQEMGAYTRDANTGQFRVRIDRMQTAVDSLAEQLLRYQGDGDYVGAKAFMAQYGKPDAALQRDIRQMDAAHIPLALAVDP